MPSKPTPANNTNPTALTLTLDATASDRRGGGRDPGVKAARLILRPLRSVETLPYPREHVNRGDVMRPQRPNCWPRMRDHTFPWRATSDGRGARADRLLSLVSGAASAELSSFVACPKTGSGATYSQV